MAEYLDSYYWAEVLDVGIKEVNEKPVVVVQFEVQEQISNHGESTPCTRDRVYIDFFITEAAYQPGKISYEGLAACGMVGDISDYLDGTQSIKGNRVKLHRNSSRDKNGYAAWFVASGTPKGMKKDEGALALLKKKKWPSLPGKAVQAAPESKPNAVSVATNVPDDIPFWK